MSRRPGGREVSATKRPIQKHLVRCFWCYSNPREGGGGWGGVGVGHEYEARPQRQMGARLAHPSLSILHTPRFSSATKVSLLVSLNLLFASPLNSTHPSLYPPALPPSPSRRLP